ncbi:MAG: FAD-dependent oxidoreductase [Kiritimatiellae bacterium]|nr:FAD-dependent oxidoreductase [Kiritimatiellia bacterium]MDD5519921.1 FAD-dependent oxidoreductase [Kiritimatiellia bacterium]
MKKYQLALIMLILSIMGIYAAETEPVVPGSLADLARFRKPPRTITMAVDGFLWIEAEDFTDYGEWRIDTQFIHKMGSAYLLAGGICMPISNAVTEIQIPQAGKYRIWVRAKNWLKEYAPGKFTISVDGQRSQHVFGAAPTEAWTWESAGDFELAKGSIRLALHDLSGAFARCDALILTRDLQYRPPEELEMCQRERARLAGIPGEVQAGDYDVVVVGAGTAGCSAAIAAARLGAKTALVQDRPVLGGNSSIELGVPPCGASVSHPNARESGIIEEAALIRAKNDYHKMSEAFHILTSAEKNLTVFFNRRVISAEMKDKATIGSVRAVDTLTLAPSVYRGKFFIDCTGDGWVGFYSGAKYRFGRESRDEFGESAAPPQADAITMSGCIMGNLALSYRAENAGKPVEYVPPPWATKLLPPEEFGRNPRGFAGGQWWLEHPGDIDDLEDPERARDELIRITFAYWGFIKNGWQEKARARNYVLTYVPHMDARRETRRLVGDYILKQQDAEAGMMFPDRISYGGWSLDVHHPKGIHSGKEGPYYFDGHVPIYSIPFRTLYSTNIVNLLFAGRNMSVTHIALGTVRVEATLATAGQAAGTAAALCMRHGITPRQLGQNHIEELQQTLLKNDQYIPEIKNEDNADLARKAKVTASSTRHFSEYTRKDVKTEDGHELNMPRAVMFPRGMTERFRTISVCLMSERKEPAELTLHLRGADITGDFSATNDLATATAMVPAGKRTYVSFQLDCAVKQPYVWIWLPKAPKVTWMLVKSSLPEGCRAYGGKTWTVVKGQQYAFYTDPALRFQTDHQPENVIDGVSRIVGGMSHLWASDPKEKMPQWLELDFGREVKLNTIQLTFDTDMNTRFPDKPVVTRCVKDYSLSFFDGKAWKELAMEKENFLRHRIHRFPVVSTSKLRLTVNVTNGDLSARVFEIRAYREP